MRPVRGGCPWICGAIWAKGAAISAILHARIVNDATALGTAVSRLIAPDQAAVMAHAGWDVISRGAAVTDKVIDLVQDTLDQQEAEG
jgi:hypothetical protein